MLEEEIPNSDIWFEKENLLQQSYEDLKVISHIFYIALQNTESEYHTAD